MKVRRTDAFMSVREPSLQSVVQVSRVVVEQRCPSAKGDLFCRGNLFFLLFLPRSSHLSGVMRLHALSFLPD